MLTRRGLITRLVGLLVAPAIVRVSNLMAISPVPEETYRPIAPPLVRPTICSDPGWVFTRMAPERERELWTLFRKLSPHGYSVGDFFERGRVAVMFTPEWKRVYWSGARRREKAWSALMLAEREHALLYARELERELRRDGKHQGHRERYAGAL